MDSRSSCTLDPVFLLGATGAGKSAVALDWAAKTGAAILSLDAMQVYRGADIGTGKPTAAERAEIPHGGLDLVEFSARFDVGQYLDHAESFLRAHREANRPVIIAGGTGLYFRALTRGLCEAPQGSDDLRAELRALSTTELRERLARIDPAILARIDAANPRRLARAIEVMETTGRSLSAWQVETTAPLVPRHDAIWLQRDKEELQVRIEQRVEAMFAAGWINEVKELQGLYSREAVASFPGIGYREIAEEIGMRTDDQYRPTEKLKRAICVATRQYAKRQLTWFAREPNLRVMTLSGPQPPAPPEFFSV